MYSKLLIYIKNWESVFTLNLGLEQVLAFAPGASRSGITTATDRC